MLLNEKIAPMIGGTGAVGSDIANRLSAQGAHVIATNRHEEGLAKIPESFKQKIAPAGADVTNAWEVTSSTTESYPLRRREHHWHHDQGVWRCVTAAVDILQQFGYHDWDIRGAPTNHMARL